MSDAVKKSDENQRDNNPNSLNFGARFFDNARYIGLPARAGFCVGELITDSDSPHDLDVDTDVPSGSLVANGSGLLIGLVLHLLLRRRYTRKQSVNPLYRNFKTLACFGIITGDLVSNFLSFLPNPLHKIIGLIIADLTSFLFGVIAIPYWLIKRRINKNLPTSTWGSLARIGIEGWSKYAKAALVFGVALGQVVGAIYGICNGINIVLPMLISGGIGGVSLFIASLIVVPLINKIFNKKLIFGLDKKDNFRTSYVRTGITLGLGICSVIGFILGTVVFPGIGSIVGLMIGGAVGSIVGGVTMGAAGERISRAIHGSNDSENSWDYATRTASFMGGFLGSLVGFFLPFPGGVLLGAAAGSVLGWGVGLCVVKIARKICCNEKKAVTLPWTQRVSTGSTIGCLIGAAIGFGFGWLGGPAGALAGFTLGTAIGGFIGGITGALYDKVAREMVAMPFKRQEINKQRMRNTIIHDGLKCQNERAVDEIEMKEITASKPPDQEQVTKDSGSLIKKHFLLFPAPLDSDIENPQAIPVLMTASVAL